MLQEADLMKNVAMVQAAKAVLEGDTPRATSSANPNKLTIKKLTN